MAITHMPPYFGSQKDKKPDNLLKWPKINVSGFVKIDPNHTGTEIYFIAEH